MPPRTKTPTPMPKSTPAAPKATPKPKAGVIKPLTVPQTPAQKKDTWDQASPAQKGEWWRERFQDAGQAAADKKKNTPAAPKKPRATPKKVTPK